MNIPKPPLNAVSEATFTIYPQEEQPYPVYEFQQKIFWSHLQPEENTPYGKPVTLHYDTEVPPNLITTHLHDPDNEPT